jgi:hypothetical protein
MGMSDLLHIQVNLSMVKESPVSSVCLSVYCLFKDPLVAQTNGVELK